MRCGAEQKWQPRVASEPWAKDNSRRWYSRRGALMSPRPTDAPTGGNCGGLSTDRLRQAEMEHNNAPRSHKAESGSGVTEMSPLSAILQKQFHPPSSSSSSSPPPPSLYVNSLSPAAVHSDFHRTQPIDCCRHLGLFLGEVQGHPCVAK